VPHPQKPPSEVVKQVAGLDPRPRPRSPRRAGVAGEWDGEGREERLAFDCPVEWKPSNQSIGGGGVAPGARHVTSRQPISSSSLSPAIVPRLGGSPTPAVKTPPKIGQRPPAKRRIQHLTEELHRNDVLKKAVQTLGVADT
jgi:hypothetical protein